MNAMDIGKSVRVLMRDGHAKSGKLVYVAERSLTLGFYNGDTKEIFYDAIASVKVNQYGWMGGRDDR